MAWENDSFGFLVSIKWGQDQIDMFNGSFSFIKYEQIVQLFRAVAANAKGYAFQLAMDNVFPDGVKWMESFQRKVQAMNQHLGNSCQLAQGVVNDLLSGADIKHKTDASLKATLSGLSEDFFSAKQEPDGKTPMCQRSCSLSGFGSFCNGLITPDTSKELS